MNKLRTASRLITGANKTDRNLITTYFRRAAKRTDGLKVTVVCPSYESKRTRVIKLDTREVFLASDCYNTVTDPHTLLSGVRIPAGL